MKRNDHSERWIPILLTVIAVLAMMDGCVRKDDAPAPLAPAVTTAPPLAPTGVVAGGKTPTSLMVWWNAVEQADSYQVCMDRSPSGPFSVWSRTTAGNVVTHTGLEHFTAYYYKVRAKNAGGWGPYSNVTAGRTERFITDSAACISPAPSVIRMWSTSMYSISLAWDSVPYADRYEVYMSLDARMEGAGKVYDNGGMAYTVTGLPARSTRYFSIRSVNDYGPGPHSVPVNGMTLPILPYVGMGMNSTPTTIMVEWNDYNVLGTEYELQRSRDNDARNAVTMYYGAWFSHRDTGLTPSTNYFYRVRAINKAGMTVWSPFTNLSTTGAP